ncbi:helix-turn-helix transcriptional regulator [Cereibacter sphaeroides]|nr:helix-turn-helix transcriptional regulator [Cereibacter sphaeroides]AZB58657.1 helix-turn-helix transcriptional regulator [Cereibacter sphaeroides]
MEGAWRPCHEQRRDRRRRRMTGLWESRSGEAEAALVHLAYELALDPQRLPDFVRLWQQRLQREAAPTPELERHFARAARILGRLPCGETGSAEAVLAGILRVPAFLSDGVVRIAACNRAAESAFRIAGGAPLAALPFEPADVVALSSTIRRVARRAEPARNLRLRSTATGATAVLRVSPVEGTEGRARALVLATEPVWPDGFGGFLQGTFALTPAETDIVHGLTLGLPLREIATLRGRSVETVRTQLRSIQQKTDTHSQPELLRLVLGLMDLALAPPEGALPAPGGRLLEALVPQAMMLPEGRRLEWLEFGDPSGTPVLHLHGELSLARWAPAAERAARARSLRVIVPIRAGYGRSDPLPAGAGIAEGGALDIAALAEHLDLPRAAILALGSDLAAARMLALLRPGLVAGILVCAADLAGGPVTRWPGFLAETARHSPEALALMVQAAFSLAARRDREECLLSACGGAVADRLVLRGSGVRAALIAGSAFGLGPGISAHAAFARNRLEAGRALPPHPAQVPIRFLQGELDPLAPPAEVHRLAATLAGAEVETLSGSARLLFLERWEVVIDRLCGIIAH